MPRHNRGRRSGGPASNDRNPKLRRRRDRHVPLSRAHRDALLGGHDLEGRKPAHVLSDEDYRSKILTLNIVDKGKALRVRSVDNNIACNADAHYTTDYETNDLVIRRGQPFDITISFNRHINVDSDSVTLQFSVGARPQESKGTLIRLKLDLKGQVKFTSLKSRWSASVQSVLKDKLVVEINTPADSIIGRYQLHVESHLPGNDEDSLRRYAVEDEGIVLLFNPWNSEDVVFMSNPDEREEYVLNEHGRIWVGSSTNNSGRPWNFGQFDDPCLEAALYLLDKAELGDSARRSPISVVRAISALANSNDENGVLEGRWTSDYPKDCTMPCAWTGSVKILDEFMTNDKPVRYGQCWVFSGIVTTLLRALGIPTRSVTNFESAHDQDGSMTIDFHVDADDEPVTYFDDSVWNFHVWNESWFRRLDLPDGYDGWQVHDATPQELSEGVMRCGPAPRRAVKEGHVYLNYDVPFVFSEVNGDKIYWKQNCEGEMEVVSIDVRAVGKNISTKCVGSNLRQDLTQDYKYPEGSPEERKVVEYVNRFSKYFAENIYKTETKDDVIFDLGTPEASVGEDITLKLKAKNNSREIRSVHGRLSVLSAFYTGVPAKRLKGQMFDLQLAADEEKTLDLTVTAKDYLGKLNPEASMQVYCAFTVNPTKQHFVTTKAFTLSRPNLEITVPDDIKTEREYQGTIKFKNPLSVGLTNGVIHLEGASVLSADVHEFGEAIKPHQTVTYNFTLKARRAGHREIDATFSSDQLCGVDGSVDFLVERNEELMVTNA